MVIRGGRRALYLLLALVLAWSVVATTAFAEGVYTPTNGYVLYLDEGTNIVWQYAQFSRIAPYAYYGDSAIEGESIVFGLSYNGTAFEKLYCTDLPSPAYGPTNYRPLNLSDSTYAAAMANKLRGIILGTYPYITLEQLQSNSGIADLTLSEAITGSQMAIWKTAHGDIVTFSDALHYVVGANVRTSNVQKTLDEQGEQFRDADDAGKAEVNERVWKLYNYLLGLASAFATKTVISEASFVSKSTPSVSLNDEGTCDVTVTTTVNVQIDTGDSLTLTAYLDDGTYYESVALSNGQSDHTITIENVPDDVAYGTVTLAIDGTQKLNDVYLVDAEGGRGVHQSLVGVLDQTVPVHAEVKAEPDRVLKIYKTAGDAALQNISFEVYYVGSVDDYREGKLNIGSKPTDADIKTYAQTELLVGTITTDANGHGSLNLHTEDGVYLVRELPNDLVTDSVAFFVSLPDWSRCGEDGNPAYTITASPKNTLVTEDVEIEKSVTEIGKDSDTFDVGENHTWIIQSSIPFGIATGKAYTITDTLDYRLTYRSLDKVELASTKEGDEAEPLVLTKDTHYTVTPGTTVDRSGNAVDTFTVSLTAAGMTKIGSVVGDGYTNYELRVYFTAQINTNADMGAEIPNDATVSYTNNVFRTYTDTSDQPEVHTGGAVILKVDSDDASRTLVGAEFEVYREATAAEVGDNKFDATIMYEGTEHKVVKVSFYATADMTGEKVTSLTTGDDGKGYIYGLAYGDYYLVETKAPDGYNKLANPVKFTIDSTSHQTGKEVKVENTTGFVLPETGGVGTRGFVLGGALLMLSAIAAAVLLRRKARV